MRLRCSTIGGATIRIDCLQSDAGFAKLIFLEHFFFCALKTHKRTKAHLQASFLFPVLFFLGPYQHFALRFPKVLHQISAKPSAQLILWTSAKPKEGNQRFIKGAQINTRTSEKMREDLVDLGQAPHSAIIGCADSRVPLETIFDTMPGDIFVLRNAGNTCTHAEGPFWSFLFFWEVWGHLVFLEGLMAQYLFGFGDFSL